jgi:hypothetical protein
MELPDGLLAEEEEEGEEEGDDDEEPYGDDNVVARFIRPGKGNLRYLDQISKVEGFCTGVGLDILLRDTSTHEKVWLDDRSVELKRTRRRTSKGIFTPREAYQELLKPVCTESRYQ